MGQQRLVERFVCEEVLVLPSNGWLMSWRKSGRVLTPLVVARVVSVLESHEGITRNILDNELFELFGACGRSGHAFIPMNCFEWRE
ncbi:hypothetical protein D3C72_2085620 [compost metagenome]